MTGVEGFIPPNSIGQADSPLYLQLQHLGCCKICTLRFLGDTRASSYNNVDEALKNKGFGDVENGHKIAKSNPCSACLGALQHPSIDDTVDKIVETLNKAEYDSGTFNVAVTLPIAFYLRAHAFWLFLNSNFPVNWKALHPMGSVIIGVKDALRYIIAPKIEERTKKKFDTSSNLVVSVVIAYSDEHKESLSLLEMYPEVFGKKQYTKRRNQNQKLVLSRKLVETMLRQTSEALFKKFYPTPPSVPTSTAVCGEVSSQHSSIFIAGRYNKYSRTLPQTPWLIKGERRMNSSVQEIIAEPIQKFARAQGNKFVSSGREDVDVRMIGKGRPFALELLDPHKTSYVFEDFRHLENIISSTHGGIVKVRNLQHVTKDSVMMLKVGEESKTKDYLAYCIAWGVNASQIQSLSSMAPIVLQQRTPVRVLHRRPVATRPKVIHQMSAAVVKVSGDAVYFTMSLRTQAGTYIKEFVHGDFGRTKPSVVELLGGAVVDVLALDVQEISLNWPPEVDYTNL